MFEYFISNTRCFICKSANFGVRLHRLLLFTAK